MQKCCGLSNCPYWRFGGRKAIESLKRFLETYPAPSSDALVFRSKRGGPLLETTVLNQGLYPALEALNLKKAGLRGFRRGCNRRWELDGIVPAVIRQQMGHTAVLRLRDSIQVKSQWKKCKPRFPRRIGESWFNWKMRRRRNCLKRMERPIGIEPTHEPWQICRERIVKDLQGTFRSIR